jgi:hypothetical protein
MDDQNRPLQRPIKTENMKLRLFLLSLFIPLTLFASAATIPDSLQNDPPSKKVRVGAYYFDGWDSPETTLLTTQLKGEFKSRESKWGWVTSSQNVMDSQILSARRAGLDFFSFCWYYNKKDTVLTNRLNKSVRYFQNSGIKNGFKYTLMVANHEGFEIGPKDWEELKKVWIKQFHNASYVKSEGKPLIVFFSVTSLLKHFKKPALLKAALADFKADAIKSGLKGVTLGTCVKAGDPNIDLAERLGFDVLTGYNYHESGFNKLVDHSKDIPLDSLQSAEKRVWTKIASQTKLNYLPVSTLGWDPRAWANKSNRYNELPYYAPLSSNSVYNSLLNCKRWVMSNPKKVTPEKLMILYAWNEYGEGAYLTPSKNGDNFLRGVRNAIDFNK